MRIPCDDIIGEAFRRGATVILTINFKSYNPDEIGYEISKKLSAKLKFEIDYIGRTPGSPKLIELKAYPMSFYNYMRLIYIVGKIVRSDERIKEINITVEIPENIMESLCEKYETTPENIMDCFSIKETISDDIVYLLKIEEMGH